MNGATIVALQSDFRTAHYHLDCIIPNVKYTRNIPVSFRLMAGKHGRNMKRNCKKTCSSQIWYNVVLSEFLCPSMVTAISKTWAKSVLRLNVKSSSCHFTTSKAHLLMTSHEWSFAVFNPFPTMYTTYVHQNHMKSIQAAKIHSCMVQ